MITILCSESDITPNDMKTPETAEKHHKFHTKHKILSWEYVGIVLSYQIHVFSKKFIKLYPLKNYFDLPCLPCSSDQIRLCFFGRSS